MQKAFAIELDRCTGCQACVLACTIENRLDYGASWRQVWTFNADSLPHLPVFHLSLACNHCEQPACLLGCPAKAYSKDPQTGAVVLNENHCIGCSYCTWVCPYAAPLFDRTRGTVTKCTFCNQRLLEGLEPACVAYCPTAALGITERAAETPIPLPGFPDTGLKPAVRFSQPPLSRPAPVPRGVLSEPLARVGARSRVSLRSEWSLLVFTLLAPVLVAWYTSVVIAAPPGGEVVPYLALGLLTIIVSGAHLGKKTRALRALLNFRTSWLSREAIFFSSFLGASAIHLGTWDFGPGQAGPLGWLIACSGFLALFSADRVYDAVPQTNQPGMHSARVLLTVGLLLSWFLQSPLLFLTLGSAKVLLYAMRKLYFYQTEKSVHTGLSFFRIVIGLLIPGALMASATGYWMGLMLVLVGEGIDRSEFYDEFEVLTPDHQILLDEREWTLRHTPTQQTNTEATVPSELGDIPK